MTRQIVHTENAPKALGPYSQAVIANGFVFLAGQTGIDPATGQLVEGDVVAQLEQIIKNLDAVLQAAGTSFEYVVKTNIFLHTMTDFPRINPVYGKLFTQAPPARTTVGGLELPLGAQIEIEMVALLP